MLGAARLHRSLSDLRHRAVIPLRHVAQRSLTAPKMAATGTAAAADAARATAEAPGGMEAEARLLDQLTSIPQIAKATARPARAGNGIQITVGVPAGCGRPTPWLRHVGSPCQSGSAAWEAAHSFSFLWPWGMGLC